MKILYDPQLIEDAVFAEIRRLESGGDRLLTGRFHRAREPVHEAPDSEDREKRFRALHLDFFQKFDMDRHLPAALADFPRVAALPRSLVRKAAHAKEEGSDLLVREDGPADERKTLLVTLRPERFLEPATLMPFLAHELFHVADMLDPAFGYRPDVALARFGASNELVRERFRVLWAVSIDGRLHRKKGLGSGGKDRRYRDYLRVFGSLDDDSRMRLFEEIWSHPAPSQNALLSIARDPRGLNASDGPVPGSACPLCRFPTYDWTKSEELTPDALALACKEFPQWRPDQGLCGQCAELYWARSRMPEVILPGTTPG